MPKVIAITGSGGFVGKYLTRHFKSLGHSVIEINRQHFKDLETLKKMIYPADVVINLAGKSVFTRWTKKNKKLIWESRINTTQKLVKIMNEIDHPIHFISSSAVGLYESDLKHTEDSLKLNDGFLSDMVVNWESEAFNYKGTTTICRFSVVLGSNGGAFQKIKWMSHLRVGAYFGNGKQPFPFIHIDDLALAMEHILDRKIDGPVNFAAPDYISYKSLIKGIKKRKSLIMIPIPAFFLKLILGEASSFLLDNPYVVPEKLLDSRFIFKQPTLKDCLNKLI